MKRVRCRTSFIWFGLLAAVTLAPPAADAQNLGQLYAAVTDTEGQPVLDLSASDFLLAIDDNPAEVVEATIGTAPMKVALMIDNGNSMAEANADTALRAALAGFLDNLAPQHEVGVFSMARNVRRLNDFTTDREELKRTTGEMFSDSGAGARMMEGLFETWDRRFEDDDAWPVFVMVLTDGGELSGYISDDDYNDFVNDLVRRGATVHAVMFSRQGAASSSGGIQLQYGMNLTQNTGGVFETINTVTGLENQLTDLATKMSDHFDQVSTRYRLLYEIPEDPGSGSISVRMNRGGLNLALFADRRLQ